MNLLPKIKFCPCCACCCMQCACRCQPPTCTEHGLSMLCWLLHAVRLLVPVLVDKPWMGCLVRRWRSKGRGHRGDHPPRCFALTVSGVLCRACVGLRQLKATGHTKGACSVLIPPLFLLPCAQGYTSCKPLVAGS